MLEIKTNDKEYRLFLEKNNKIHKILLLDIGIISFSTDYIFSIEKIYFDINNNIYIKFKGFKNLIEFKFIRIDSLG